MSTTTTTNNTTSTKVNYVGAKRKEKMTVIEVSACCELINALGDRQHPIADCDNFESFAVEYVETVVRRAKDVLCQMMEQQQDTTPLFEKRKGLYNNAKFAIDFKF